MRIFWCGHYLTINNICRYMQEVLKVTCESMSCSKLKTQKQTASKHLQDIHREKALLNETLAITNSMNMDIWVGGTSNQLFIN